MQNKTKKLILIDGNAIIHRSYHALPPFTTKKGELVNAVYGFASTLISILGKFQPDYIIATFDLAGPTFRHLEYEKYKATRVKGDDALYAQIPRVKEITRAFGIPIYEVSGFEADDVIGTLAAQANKNSSPPTGGLETIIVTGDMDTLQLVDDKTKVYTMRRGLTDAALYGKAEIFERFSLAPEQLIDYKGLRGDPSDNIPGVKGIGEKTAIELLKKYGSLENIYTHLEEIKGAIKDKLEKDKLLAIQSKSLATISKAVPIELDLEKAVTREFDRQKLLTLFEELNFHSLKKRITNTDSKLRMEFESTNMNKNAGVKDFKFEIADNKNFKELLENLKNQKELAIKLKTAGTNAHNSTLLGIATAYKTGRAVYFDLEDKNIFAEIKNILENENIEKIGFDLKSDLEVLQTAGINLSGNFFDIMISAYLLNPGRKILLADLVSENLNEEIAEENKKGQLGLEIETQEKAAKKLCAAADYIFKLKNIHKKEIEKISAEQLTRLPVNRQSLSADKHNQPMRLDTLSEVFSKVEMPLVKILAQMELNGIKLNSLIFQGISQTIAERIVKLEKNIYALSGESFNISSPKQLSEVLFEKMKLPVDDLKKGKSGVISTASSELEKIRDKHKIIEKIEEYRELSKLKNTYLDSLPLMIDKNSRLHTSFNQAVTATGRLSSSEPNLQNIPIRTDLGQLLRTAFVAEKKWKLVSADYSQIDLRVVAHVSGDKKMIELFHKGEDIHRATAAEINKIPLSQVTEKIRRTAKELNFGVIYGMGSFGFASRTGISKDDARKFINAYFEKFQGVANYMRETKESAKKNGFVETQIGRRRYLPEINSSNFQLQSMAERMAINMPIQGLAADIMKIAMINVYEEYKNNPDVKMLLQVHDEIILEVKEEIAESVAKKIKLILENAYPLRVPLVANVKIGDNWGEI